LAICYYSGFALQSLSPVLDCVLALHSTAHAERLIVLWSTDDDERSSALFEALTRLRGITIVRIVHDGPSDRADREPMLAMTDLAFLGEADDDAFIGTSRSSFSFVAHARALLRPRFVGHMRQGHICVPGASSEGGLVSVGDMHGKCDVVRLYESYSPDFRTRPRISEVMRCRERIQNCVSLGPGDFGTFVRSGAGSYCLQDVLRSCMRGNTISEAGFEQYIESWAAEFDAGIDSGKALEYRWSRDREYILRTSYPRGMRTCGEGSFGESEGV
jgi:hypothetical protein